jgi:hypothetical protein
VFVPGKLFKPSLMLVGEARSLFQRTTPDKMFHLGRLQPYSQTFILGWKSLPRTNTLAFYKNFVNYGRKFFITLGPGVCIIKLITAIIISVT